MRNNYATAQNSLVYLKQSKVVLSLSISGIKVFNETKHCICIQTDCRILHFLLLSYENLKSSGRIPSLDTYHSHDLSELC